MAEESGLSPGEDVLVLARRWLAEGRRAALATVVSTWGSVSAAGPGKSRLLVDEQGRFPGGRCREGASKARWCAEALEVMESGTPRLLEYGVSNEPGVEVGLACGRPRAGLRRGPGMRGTFGARFCTRSGAARAVVRRHLLESLLQARTAKAPCAVLTDLSSGPPGPFPRRRSGCGCGFRPGSARPPPAPRWRADRSGVRGHGLRPGVRACLQSAAAPGGGGSGPYRAGARADGGDDGLRGRGPWTRGALSQAKKSVFPGVTLIGDWPDDALAALAPDVRTALVTFDARSRSLTTRP